ncbi:hypothetical protein TorRG33x02_323340 [Trema orientale]|uniref:DUF1677 family protein n=1 Tax=Trema orientale TaxID=63057 RepID=A0A2P5BF50_TREOI|nr:hypothetical protein TorRG33x02_323340 [Trema orientale]
MAPNRENLMGSSSSSKSEQDVKSRFKPPPRLSMESLQRTISDISLELITKESIDVEGRQNNDLPAISEVEEAKCECCGMAEECTPDYINRLRRKFSGKLVCGICAEAVSEEMEKKGVKRDEALKEHMSACSRFNKLGRTYPVLYQAEAVKEILKKSASSSNISARAKSLSPRDYKGTRSSGGQIRKGTGVLARSSSCIPTIIRKDLD